jgi:hypothetical protein
LDGDELLPELSGVINVVRHRIGNASGLETLPLVGLSRSHSSASPTQDPAEPATSTPLTFSIATRRPWLWKVTTVASAASSQVVVDGRSSWRTPPYNHYVNSLEDRSTVWIPNEVVAVVLPDRWLTAFDLQEENLDPSGSDVRHLSGARRSEAPPWRRVDHLDLWLDTMHGVILRLEGTVEGKTALSANFESINHVRPAPETFAPLAPG